MGLEKDVIVGYLKEYIDDLKDGKINKMQLARLILKDHPEVFKKTGDYKRDLESLRSNIKSCTLPKYIAKNYLDPTLTFKSTQEHGMKSVSLPKSPYKEIKDYIFPYSKPLVISDIHIPYHDNNAIIAAVEFAKERNIDSVLINGDLLDCYQLSKYDRDPRNMSFAQEIEMGKAFVDWLKQELKVPVIFKLGNHEFRWEQLMKTKAPELIGLDVFEWEGLLNHYEWNVKVVQQNQKIKFGKLNIIHGHEFKYGVYSPVNPARGIYTRSKVNTLVGHWHQISEHSESNLNKDAVSCWSTGCLCTLSPEYSPFAYVKWSHGAAILKKESNGNFYVNNFTIANGEVL